MKYLWVTPLALLAGCGNQGKVVVNAPPPQVERTYLKEIIPADELTCEDAPDGGATKSIRQSAKYITELQNVQFDCRQKLLGVRDIILNEQ